MISSKRAQEKINGYDEEIRGFVQITFMKYKTNLQRPFGQAWVEGPTSMIVIGSLSFPTGNCNNVRDSFSLCRMDL